MRKAIVFAVLAAAAFGDEAQTAFDALKKDYEAAVQEFLRPAREAQAKGEKVQLDYTKHPNGEYAGKFAAFAKEHPKTEAAAQALAMVLRMTRDETTRKDAAEALVRDHLDSPVIKGALYSFDAAGLRMIAEKSPQADVRGFALHRLASVEAQAGQEKEAIALFREVKEKYGDVAWGTATLAQKADGGIYEIEHLGIGKVAPEIEGEDLDGKPMKLGDFKGRVVVLDFWGDW